MVEDYELQTEPRVESLDIEDESDVYEMIDQGEIGRPEEYGYEELDKFVSDVIRRVVADQQYDILQEASKLKWSQIEDIFSEAGGVIYNPENTDQYYTNEEKYE